MGGIPLLRTSTRMRYIVAAMVVAVVMALLAVIPGSAGMTPVAQAAPTSELNKTVHIASSDGGGFINLSMRLKSAGRGTTEPDKLCYLTESLGYPDGDNSTDDGKACIGEEEKYRPIWELTLSAATGSEPVSFYLDPEYFTEDLPENAREVQKPELRFPAGSTSSVKVEKTADNRWKFTVAPNTTGNTYYDMNLYSSGYTIPGKYLASFEVRDGKNEENVLGNVSSDRPVELLGHLSHDLYYNSYSSDPYPSRIKGERYQGITADYALYPLQNRSKTNYNIGFITPREVKNQPMKFTVEDVPGLDVTTEKFYAIVDGKRVEMQRGEDGKPYFLFTHPSYARENFRPKFYIPLKNLPKNADVQVKFRLDPVDEEGNLSVVRAPEYGKSTAPLLKTADPKYGLDKVDPGAGQTCDTDIRDGGSGLYIHTTRDTSIREPNNNCGRAAVHIDNVSCPDGCKSGKFDILGGREKHTTDDGEGYSDTNIGVKLTIRPDDATGDNPKICVAWEPGVQKVRYFGHRSKYESPFAINSFSGENLIDRFPGVKIYRTYENLVVNPGDNASIDCSDATAKWEKTYDKEAGLTNVKLDGVAEGRINGFLIELPQEIDSTFDLIYQATRNDYSKIKQGKLLTSRTDEMEYYKMPNYMRVKPTDEEWEPVSRSFFLHPKIPAVQVDHEKTDGPKVFPSINSSEIDFQINPRINFLDQTEGIIDGVDVNGDPIRLYSRVYLSKCLRVDPASATEAGATYHALPEDEYSTDPNDCGVDKNHYIERVWKVSGKPNTTGNPSDDPFFPAEWVESKVTSPSAGTYYYEPTTDGDKTRPPFKFKLISPDFGIPNQVFPTYHESRLTGGYKNYMTSDNDGMRYGTDYNSLDKDVIGNAYINKRSFIDRYIYSTPAVSQLLAVNVSDTKVIRNNASFKHTAQLVNSTSIPYAETEYIDLLPYNGDPFGSEFHGKYWLDKMPAPQGSVDKSKLKIFYTTDDPTTVSLCPQGADLTACSSRSLRDIDKAPSNTQWKELTPEILESLKGPDGSERITALRFVSEELPAKSTMRFQMTYKTDDNRKDNVYASTMGAAKLNPVSSAGKIRTLQRPEIARTKVIYSASIAGNVYRDADRNNDKNGEEPGLADYTVELLNEQGEVIRRTTTGPDGNYLFEGVQAGNYKVRVVVPNPREKNTEAGFKEADRGTLTATDVVLREGVYGPDGGVISRPIDRVENLDFGIAQLVPSITLDKVIGDADSKTTETEGSANSPVKFTVFGANTGDLELTEVHVNDTWVAGKEPLTQTCVIKDSTSNDVTAVRGNLTSAQGATLQPKDTYECTSTYSVTQADIDAGVELVNTASISAKADEDEVSAPAKTAKITMPEGAAIKLARNVILPDGVAASADDRLVEGDKIHYAYTITNTGKKTINNVSLADDGVPGFENLVCKRNDEVVNLADLGLAPGDVVTCETAEVTVDKELVAKQTVTTTPVVSGEAGAAQTPVNDTVETATQYLGTPALSLNKSVKDKAAKYRAGQTVTYEFVVTNTGNTRLDKTKLADPMEELKLTCPEGYENLLSAEGMTLPVNGTVTCTGTYEVTQSDVDNHNELPNTATATAGLRNSPALSQTSDAVVELDNDASIAVEIDVKDKRDANDPYVEGDDLVYTFTITNDGLATLKNITLTDKFAAGKGLEPVCTKDGQPVNLSEITLAPGEKISCESPKYTLKAEDITPERTIENSVVATGSGVSQTSPKKVTSGEPEVVIPTAVPAISLNKTVVDPKAAYVSGDKVTYSLVVTNQGATKLTGVKLVDSMPGIKELSCPAGHENLVSENGGELAANESVTCTAKYTVTQANVDNGEALVNSAKVVGATRNAPQVSANSEAPINFSSEKSISLVQTVVPSASGEGPESVDGKYVAGDKVVHEYLITNTGSVTLNNLKLNKGHTDGTLVCHLADDESVNVNLDTFELAPGKAIKCTSTHVVTAEEAANPTLANPSTVAGTPATGGDSVDSSSPVEVNLGQPAVSLAKNVKDRKDTYRAGEVVTYEFAVANVGNTELNNVKLADPMEGLKLSCPAGFEGLLSDGGMTLPAAGTDGSNVICTGTYTVNQENVDSASDIPNSATVSGALRGVSVKDESNTSVAVSKNQSIKLEQSVTPSASGQGPDSISGDYVEGDTVNYTYVITNTGDVTLKNLRLDKGHTDGTLVCVTNDDEAANVNLDIATLAPGKSIKCTSSHVVTKEEVAAGPIRVNPATVKALPPTGDADLTDVTETEVALAVPAVSLVKQIEGKQDGYLAGEEVKYSFTVANQGKTKLEGVKLTDPLEGIKLNCPAGFSGLLSEEGAALAPLGEEGSSVTCTGTYVLTQADLDKANSLSNTAAVNAGLRNSTPLVVESTARAGLKPEAKLVLTKEIQNPSAAGYGVGDKIIYVLTVKNEGSVTLTDPVVSDSMLAKRGVALNCPTVKTLAPGQSFSCVASPYALASEEATGEDLTNIAVVTAKSPLSTGEEILTAQDTVSAKTIVPPVPEATPEAAPTLPVTGSDVATYGGAALVLLFAGGSLLIVARRKKERCE